MDQKPAFVKMRANFEDSLKHGYCGQAPSDKKVVARIMHMERCGQRQCDTLPGTLRHKVSRGMCLGKA
jgi:hypothetical protein